MVTACDNNDNRKFHLRWDSEDRNLIKEAIIYTFPLFQSESPRVVYEAAKFMVALINANRTNKSINQRIDDCRAWRSSGQSYKVPAVALHNCQRSRLCFLTVFSISRFLLSSLVIGVMG
jgi:hypothetical protein